MIDTDTASIAIAEGKGSTTQQGIKLGWWRNWVFGASRPIGYGSGSEGIKIDALLFFDPRIVVPWPLKYDRKSVSKNCNRYVLQRKVYSI